MAKKTKKKKSKKFQKAELASFAKFDPTKPARFSWKKCVLGDSLGGSAFVDRKENVQRGGARRKGFTRVTQYRELFYGARNTNVVAGVVLEYFPESRQVREVDTFIDIPPLIPTILMILYVAYMEKARKQALAMAKKLIVKYRLKGLPKGVPKELKLK